MLASPSELPMAVEIASTPHQHVDDHVLCLEANVLTALDNLRLSIKLWSDASSPRYCKYLRLPSIATGHSSDQPSVSSAPRSERIGSPR